MNDTTATRPRVLAYLARQDAPKHLGAITRGAGVSRESARAHLRDLAAAGRVRIDMSSPGSPGYQLTQTPEVRVSVKDPDGAWRDPETTAAAVLALRALADPKTLGTLGADGRGRIRAALDELDVALAGYPGGERPGTAAGSVRVGMSGREMFIAARLLYRATDTDADPAGIPWARLTDAVRSYPAEAAPPVTGDEISEAIRKLFLGDPRDGAPAGPQDSPGEAPGSGGVGAGSGQVAAGQAAGPGFPEAAAACHREGDSGGAR